MTIPNLVILNICLIVLRPSKTCTRTQLEPKSYWEVDLGKEYWVDHLEIFGRTDCCSNRVVGAKVSQELDLN